MNNNDVNAIIMLGLATQENDPHNIIYVQEISENRVIASQLKIG